MNVGKRKDFWWIDCTGNTETLRVNVGHHETERNPDTCWFHSVSHEGFATSEVLYPLTFVDEWRRICHNENVYCGRTIFDSESGHAVATGPFVVDIDNEEYDLEDTLLVTRLVVDHLVEIGITKDDFRAFFTGRKGFSVEIRPESLGLCGEADEDRQLKAIAREIRSRLGVSQTQTANQISARGTLIDRPHDYVRLNDSMNAWLAERGELVSRRKFEVEVDSLTTIETREILAQSEAGEAAL